MRARVTFFDVLPMWPTPISSLKSRSLRKRAVAIGQPLGYGMCQGSADREAAGARHPILLMLARLQPSDSIGGMEPSCSQ